MTDASTYRVLLIGSALVRDPDKLFEHLRSLRLALWKERRPLVLVFDNYPSGLLEIAADVVSRLGIAYEVHEPTNPKERLVADARWAKLIEKGHADMVLCIKYRGSMPYHRATTAAANAAGIEVYEYDETE